MSPANPQSRRDFLRGGTAKKTAEKSDAAAPVRRPPGEEPATTVDPTARPYLTKVGRRAMACEFQVYFNAGQFADAEVAAIEALDVVEAIEAQLTVYREESELSRLNRQAGRESVSIADNLYELIERCVDLFHQTDAAFDITSGPLSKIWGFARREGRVPEAKEIATAREHIGSHLVELDANGPSVRFLDPQVEINLGGIGKGYALDEAAECLAAGGVDDYLLHGGKSSVLARGRHLEHPHGWSVGLVHPLNPKQRIAEIALIDQALSTSGSGTQFIRHQGRRLGHILDPRTGWPAEGVLSATVVCDSAAEADALSTALFVLGPEKAKEFCDRRPDVQAVLIVSGEREGTIRIEPLNIDPQRWALLDS
ncbi:MAG: FAD:protein FMN transferase [Planctomycetota bacterium]|nr:MAG: FAD:protein FMN transferase [Planctomycetota bacterium]REK40953.1 MAG: FAD:protein FMN transferase [Planctomycetota bacterium]